MIIQEPEENYKTGWVKFYRSIMKHWIWSNEKYFKCWSWFLFEANHSDNKMLFNGNLITIEKGQFITSLKHISEASKLSIQETRHFLTLLEKDKMIVKNSNTQSTKITICNYGIYQDAQQTNNKQATNEQHTDNTPTTTNKNVKNEKELFIEKIKKDFYQSLTPFLKEFGKEILREFYEYWSEPNKSKTKIRYQLEKTWDTRLRLLRWVKNDFGKKKTEEMKLTQQEQLDKHYPKV